MSDNPQQREGSRRRIVIPLNQDQAPSRLGRVPGSRSASRDNASKPVRVRVRRVLTVLLVAIVAAVLLAAGGAFLWWQHYKTTPTYALALLVDAAQRNDMAGVDKIVDTDKIAAHFADQVAEKAAARYGAAISGDLRKTIAASVPGLLPQLRPQVRDALAARVKEIGAQADQKPFVVIAAAMPYFVKVTTMGDAVADATVTVHDQHIALEMLKSADGWRLVSVQDDALVGRLVDGVIKDLPAIAPGFGADFRKKNSKPPAALRIP